MTKIYNEYFNEWLVPYVEDSASVPALCLSNWLHEDLLLVNHFPINCSPKAQNNHELVMIDHNK